MKPYCLQVILDFDYGLIASACKFLQTISDRLLLHVIINLKKNPTAVYAKLFALVGYGQVSLLLTLERQLTVQRGSNLLVNHVVYCGLFTQSFSAAFTDTYSIFISVSYMGVASTYINNALVTGNPHPPHPGEKWGIRQLNEKK